MPQKRMQEAIQHAKGQGNENPYFTFRDELGLQLLDLEKEDNVND